MSASWGWLRRPDVIVVGNCAIGVRDVLTLEALTAMRADEWLLPIKTQH